MNLDVISVGAAGFDIFVSGKDFKLSHITRDTSIALHTDVTYKIEHAIYEVGGSGMNAAITFARQGIRTGCIARTGKDHLANQIKILAKYEQIEHELLINKPEHHTDLNFHIITDRNKDIKLRYDNSFCSLRPKDLYFPGLKTRLLYLAELPYDFKLYKFFATWARANHIQLAVNIMDFHNYRRKQINFVLTTANVVLMPINFAQEIFVETSDPAEILRQIYAFGAKSIVLYDVTQEAYAFYDDTVYHCGVYRKLNPLDITGCNDVFCAGFMSAYFQQKSIPEALTLASANACSVAEVFGTRSGILKKPALRTIKTTTEVL
jgi:sugar/nucleoside kinase (ribokinase family)